MYIVDKDRWLYKYSHLYAYRHYYGKYTIDDYTTSRMNHLLMSFEAGNSEVFHMPPFSFINHKKCYEYCIK